MSVDDKPLELGAAMQAISVDPGMHHVAVQRDGAMLAEKDVAVGGDAPLQADVTLDLAPRIAPETALRPAAQRSRPALSAVPATRRAAAPTTAVRC